MSRDNIEQFVIRADKIINLIIAGELTETEIELINTLLDGLADPARRPDVLRSFTRTMPTIPPPPPEDLRITVEPEMDIGDGRQLDETQVTNIPIKGASS
jgi:hypothetical protein